MALAAEVIARYPSSRLIQLTRQSNQSGSSINTTILGLAVDDVEADFQIIAGVEYDNSDARHVGVAVEGVIAKLARRAEAAGNTSEALHDAYLERLGQLAKVTGRDRIMPKTKSPYTVTSERDREETPRPWDDWPNYDDIQVNPPR